MLRRFHLRQMLLHAVGGSAWEPIVATANARRRVMANGLCFFGQLLRSSGAATQGLIIVFIF